MNRRCKDCNRDLDEYYQLRNGTIMCYDCWKRAKEIAYSRTAENHSQFLADQRRHRDIELQVKNLDAEISHLESNSDYQSYFTYDEGNLYSYDRKPPNYDYVQSLKSKANNLRQETFRTPQHRSLPDYSYLENPTFYSRERIQREKEENRKWREQERREAEEQRKKEVEETFLLFDAVKKQEYTPETINEANQYILEITQLLETKTYDNYMQALDLMKKEHEWHFNTTDTFKSAIYNLTENRQKFSEQREETKKKAYDCLDLIKRNLVE